MKSSVLVIGASGQVGSEIVRLLKEQGHRVRATTGKKGPNKVQDGVEKVYLNLLTGEGIKDAFEGVQRAFLLSPAGYADQYGVLSPLIQEAKRRGLEKVVLMTAMGADAVETSPMRRAELELEKSGLRYNIIRPNWFMQNFHTFWIQGIREQSKILLPAGKAKTSFIDARDISAVAARLLVSDELSDRDFDLTGPEAIDHDHVAQEISKATGKRVTYEDIDPKDFHQGLLKAGLPKDYSEFLSMIMGFLKEGYAAKVTANVKLITGQEPIAIQKYAADYKQAWA